MNHIHDNSILYFWRENIFLNTVTVLQIPSFIQLTPIHSSGHACEFSRAAEHFVPLAKCRIRAQQASNFKVSPNPLEPFFRSSRRQKRVSCPKGHFYELCPLQIASNLAWYSSSMNYVRETVSGLADFTAVG